MYKQSKILLIKRKNAHWGVIVPQTSYFIKWNDVVKKQHFKPRMKLIYLYINMDNKFVESWEKDQDIRLAELIK